MDEISYDVASRAVKELEKLEGHLAALSIDSRRERMATAFLAARLSYFDVRILTPEKVRDALEAADLLIAELDNPK